MDQCQLSKVVGHVRRLVGVPAGEAPGDRALLEAFARGDGAAFTELVERHGALVYGTCRAVLRDPHAAEDVFQATWLVLARKAGAVRWADSVAPWLHQVALRLAHKARVRAA